MLQQRPLRTFAVGQRIVRRTGTNYRTSTLAHRVVAITPTHRLLVLGCHRTLPMDPSTGNWYPAQHTDTHCTACLLPR